MTQAVVAPKAVAQEPQNPLQEGFSLTIGANDEDPQPQDRQYFSFYAGGMNLPPNAMNAIGVALGVVGVLGLVGLILGLTLGRDSGSSSQQEEKPLDDQTERQPRFETWDFGQIKAAWKTVTLPDPATKITVREAQLTATQLEKLSEIATHGVVTEPLDFSADPQIVAQGTTIKQTLPTPLLHDQFATLMYWDDESEDWVAVDSTVSLDRMTISTTVNHLSLWTTYIGPSIDFAQRKTVEAAETIATNFQQTVEDVQELSEQLDRFNQRIAQTAANAASDLSEWTNQVRKSIAETPPTFYNVTKRILGNYASTPVCEENVPEWYDESIGIGPASEKDGVKLCAGSSEWDEDILEVKMVVSRMSPYFVSRTNNAGTWANQLEEDQTAHLKRLLALDSTIEGVFTFIAQKTMIFPQQEVTLRFTEEEVRQANNRVTLQFDLMDEMAALVYQVLTRSVDIFSPVELLGVAVSSLYSVFSTATDLNELPNDPLLWVDLVKQLAEKAVAFLIKTGQESAGVLIGLVLSLGYVAMTVIEMVSISFLGSHQYALSEPFSCLGVFWR